MPASSSLASHKVSVTETSAKRPPNTFFYEAKYRNPVPHLFPYTTVESQCIGGMLYKLADRHRLMGYIDAAMILATLLIVHKRTGIPLHTLQYAKPWQFRVDTVDKTVYVKRTREELQDEVLANALSALCKRAGQGFVFVVDRHRSHSPDAVGRQFFTLRDLERVLRAMNRYAQTCSLPVTFDLMRLLSTPASRLFELDGIVLQSLSQRIPFEDKSQVTI